MEQLTLPASHQAQGSITLPGSKSISNRTLLLAALSTGSTQVINLLASDDTARMLESLEKLGVILEKTSGGILVHGCSGDFPNKNAELFLGNAGTAFRPLTAALAFSNGHYTLSGVPRMHERPIGDLVDALRQAGANIEYLGNEGYPPLKISPANVDVSKPIEIRGNVSSQFLTALLMALPLTNQNSTIKVIGKLISKPYINITVRLMQRFNITVPHDDEWQNFTISAEPTYKYSGDIIVEGDASSASYFLAAGVIGGKVKVEGVGENSIQGDIHFAEALELMGATINYADNWMEASAPQGRLRAINLDCNHIPDAAMTLAILALFAEGTTTLRNIASWRVKETDRIAAMATELRKVGATVEEGADYIKITPPAQLTPNAVIDTYDDHRMAMCFSLVSLGGVPITINDPKCVNKTFPDYFAQFASIVK
ncbi:3-phosphoshikimate 1-carboxyvinyltransferase [Methylotenera sp.]|uniref:3-phosphoshikimate 1-carboxyvinyltransferase n=1 Tax=Methylotenera sp. TaxID=2051956 RepID=UPI002489B470|nr:3-phosphoshikimate 1-carboxyvinyltransferase [Methylotenera sp.]MDI1298535.1 3-phosphoshikimate 1-carboxyvinyltransferase [Methylotenera sp.]